MTRERILVVDDDRAMGGLLARMCRDEGYDVDLASDGRSAIAYLDERTYALAIVDLLLPDVSGLKVLRHALVLDPHMPVIMLTGHATYESAVEALNLGALEYVEKGSLSMRLMPLIVRRAIAQRRLRASNEALLRQMQQNNEELARHRAQQMRAIQQTGLALAAGPQLPQVLEVLGQAVLDAMDCDGAAIVVTAGDASPAKEALVASRRPLAPEAHAALLDALLQRATMPPLPATAVQARSVSFSEGRPDAEPWRCTEVAPLLVRDQPLGVVIAAAHARTPFPEEALAAWRILVTQGSIAVENALLFERLRALATRDGLTGLHNRSYLHQLLEAEISRSQRRGYHFAVIMLDIDRERGLKHINDTFGHQTGDAVLRAIAELLVANVRRSDAVARYGGDEFVVLAPETDRSEALILATRLCRRLSGTPLRIMGREFAVTASVGAAVYEPQSGLGPDALLELADRAMYEVKQSGGNRALLARS